MPRINSRLVCCDVESVFNRVWVSITRIVLRRASEVSQKQLFIHQSRSLILCYYFALLNFVNLLGIIELKFDVTMFSA